MPLRSLFRSVQAFSLPLPAVRRVESTPEAFAEHGQCRKFHAPRGKLDKLILCA